MVGLLDGGLAASFGAVFGAYFLDGSLHRQARVDGRGGDVSVTWTDAPIKYQPDKITEAMRQAAGYTDKDAAFLVLQSGVSPEPTSAEQMTASGRRWAIASIEADPANTYWLIRATPA